MRNSIMQSILERFAAAGIQFAYPHVSLHAAPETAPLPLAVTGPLAPPRRSPMRRLKAGNPERRARPRRAAR